MAQSAPSRAPRRPREKSTPELMSSIASDVTTLVRKEMELARQEIVEAIVARVKAAAALAAAGVLGLLVVVFGALAAADALSGVTPEWAARLIVAGGFAVLALVAVAFAIRRFKAPPLAPEETKRTVKEDVEWAKAQLRR